jgi:L-amino acid N-acyltransferase YncA
MRTALCDRSHVETIRSILNDAILHTTAVWDYEPRTSAAMLEWFTMKQRLGLPVIGLFEDERLIGFGTYGPFRAWQGYKLTAEHSLYVASDHRGRGGGTLLLRELLRHAADAGLRTLVAGIASENTVSIALHERLGFSRCGTIRDAGFKFGRWLDLTFMQRILGDEP